MPQSLSQTSLVQIKHIRGFFRKEAVHTDVAGKQEVTQQFLSLSPGLEEGITGTSRLTAKATGTGDY